MNDMISRPLIHRDAKHGGPIYWDTSETGHLWLGTEVWLNMEDATDFAKSLEAKEFAEEHGGTLMFAVRFDVPTAYLDPDPPLDAREREVLPYLADETCDRCGASGIEAQIKDACPVLCAGCVAEDGYPEDLRGGS